MTDDRIRDPHLPEVHLRPPANWINDPNGLVHHDGWYHVFFQHNPQAPTHDRVHWGHYRSRDLLRWEPQPIALAPELGRPDEDGCFSGNAVSHNGRITAFYSAHRVGRPWQPVAAADSGPDGSTFVKRPGLVVPDPPAGVTTFRDPYVWRDGDRWRMLVGAGYADGDGAALAYSSPDLADWAFDGPLHRRADPAPDGSALRTGEAWECPQLAVYDDGRALLLTSAWYQRTGPSHVVAWAGQRDGEGFRFGATSRFDYGPDFYAAALMPAPGGRWLLWGWSWEAREESCAKEAGWAGVLTVPREVTLRPDGSPHQAPARELDGLRTRTWQRAMRAQPGAESVLGSISSAADIRVRLGFGRDPAWGLRIMCGEGGAGDLDFLDLEIGDGSLTVDRGHASTDARAHVGAYRMPLPELAPGAELELRIILDHSIAEIFSGTGEALTLRFYPARSDTWTVVSRGLASDAVEVTVTAHGLRTPGAAAPA
ncbi:glycoside hydrolase family 32 protein [Streptomyces sp. A7024]|uniref:beta-fructofuranosidase n=1 Tax=Streptomyces coryli TaxID=1128680 RepID=A0A6G4TTN1_9ACTN|nr:glycoside hydrolase family 32 protein [Streptomyces coryli]